MAGALAVFSVDSQEDDVATTAQPSSCVSAKSTLTVRMGRRKPAAGLHCELISNASPGLSSFHAPDRRHLTEASEVFRRSGSNASRSLDRPVPM